MIDFYANKPLSEVPLIGHKERFYIPYKKELKPKVDEIISKIVGKKVLAQDPRLLKLVVKWKKDKSQDSMEPDNFLENPKFIEELKLIFSKEI